MARNNAMQGFDFSENAVFGYSALLVPEAYTDPKTGAVGKARFNANFWLPSDGLVLKELRAAMAAVARQQFGPNLEQFKADSDIEPKTKWQLLSFPLKSGERINADRVKGNKGELDFAKGKVRLVARTGEKYRPVLACVVNGKPTNLKTKEEQEPYLASHFYSGALVRAVVTLVGWESEMGGGVSAQLDAIWSTGAGDRTGGPPPVDVASRFGNHVGIATAEDPIGADELVGGF